MGRNDGRDGPEPRTLSRRGFFTGAAMTAAAAAAAKMVADAKPALAADGQPLVIGQNNSGSSQTLLTTSFPSGSGLFTLQTLGGSTRGGAVFGIGFGSVSAGVVGGSPTCVFDPNEPVPVSAGVFGIGGSDIGVRGTSNQAPGVVGSGFPGIRGESLNGSGVVGITGLEVLDPNSPIPIAGVFGESAQFPGIYGVSLVSPGVFGQSQQDPGVFGVSGTPNDIDPNDPAPHSGVFGLADTGTGVSGLSSGGIGIRGVAFDGSQPGVLAGNRAVGGLGLQVDGRTRFSAAGTGSIPRRATVKTIQTDAVGPQSVVLVMLKSNAGAVHVRWIELLSNAFKVHLSGRTARTATFNWLVLN